MERHGSTGVSVKAIASATCYWNSDGSFSEALWLYLPVCSFLQLLARMVRCGAARNVRCEPVVRLHVSRQPPVDPTIVCRIGARLVPLIGSRTSPSLLILWIYLPIICSASMTPIRETVDVLPE
jgi:hypothetical protein